MRRAWKRFVEHCRENVVVKRGLLLFNTVAFALLMVLSFWELVVG